MDEEKKLSKIGTFIKNNLLNFIVIATSIAYVFWEMVEIQGVDITFAKASTKIIAGVIIGFIIKQCLGEEGFAKGYNSMIWLEQIEKYNNACNLANPYIDRVNNFYEKEETEKKKKYRVANLMAVRLKYSDFFDEMGNYIQKAKIVVKSPKNRQIQSDSDVIILTRHQNKILNKCVRVKIYNLNLFSEYGNEIENDTKKEKTDAEQRLLMTGKNSLPALFTAIAGAYISMLWKGWNWGVFVGATIQVCIWVACGILNLYKNYNYVAVEKVDKLKRKMELLIKFTRGCENGEYANTQIIDKEEKQENENREVVALPTICVDTTDSIHTD